MPEVEKIRVANREYAARHQPPGDAKPSRHIAVITCMDARIDVFAALGLRLGDAHVLRNAGGRVTDDMLRSLALSSHVLGVDTVVVMQHSRCGLAGVTDDDLKRITGADVEFLPIDDHHAAVRADVERIASTDYLAPIVDIAGFVYDVDTGALTDVVRWERDQ